MDGLSWPLALENVAVVLALAYVWLAARGNIWCWPCALVSTLIYTLLFWQVTLVFQAFLNAYYVIMALYGWAQWRKHQDRTDGHITGWRLGTHAIVIAGLSTFSMLLASTAANWFDSEHLYQDVFVTVFSLFVTYMVTQKVLENWLYWIGINAVAAQLYWSKGLYPTAVLFVCYLGMALYGYASWKKQAQRAPQ